jgi:hypothetical protein
MEESRAILSGLTIGLLAFMQCFPHGVPNDFQFQLFDEDWDHFSILMRYTPVSFFCVDGWTNF